MPIDLEILELTNTFRDEFALPPLMRHQDLSRIAAKHAADVADGRAPFSHSGAPERFAACSTRCLNVAENLARSDGFGREDLPMAAVQGWQNSEGHRRNLLGPFDVCGIGWAASDSGTIFITQLLALLDERDAPCLREKASRALCEAARKLASSTPVLCAALGLAMAGPVLALSGGVVGGVLSYGYGLKPQNLPLAACSRATSWLRPSQCARCGVSDGELLLSTDGMLLCVHCHPAPLDLAVWHFVE